MEELKELAKGDDRILFTGFVQGAMLDELSRPLGRTIRPNGRDEGNQYYEWWNFR